MPKSYPGCFNTITKADYAHKIQFQKILIILVCTFRKPEITRKISDTHWNASNALNLKKKYFGKNTSNNKNNFLCKGEQNEKSIF